MVIKIWKYNYNSLNIYKLSNRSIYIYIFDNSLFWVNTYYEISVLSYFVETLKSTVVVTQIICRVNSDAIFIIMNTNPN